MAAENKGTSSSVEDYLRATAEAVGLSPDAAVAHLDQTLAHTRDAAETVQVCSGCSQGRHLDCAVTVPRGDVFGACACFMQAPATTEHRGAATRWCDDQEMRVNPHGQSGGR